ncbi:metal-response element-binding transcription factor 2 isoform X3 [Linepithema humile]|uniref:metal-response element-binding transcription factor 2 isoform X3 n=1 Tax=Linepithema humile TaxID=83485 RepID=UPI0006238798|nr:PREDICTED: metal-response element-binding transcription factor 2 isoform X3 [Linepithema humile]
MSEPEENLAAPDSTTREQRVGFSHGDDVLQHQDGKFYLGTIVEVDLARERCLVNFMDGTSSWSSFKELTKLAMPDSDVMCVLCKISQPKTDDDIIVCDKCGRGYHQMCHEPQIPKQEPGVNTHWMCKRCTDSKMRLRQFGEPKTSMVKANIRKVCSGRDQPPPPPDDMKKLPYDPDMLSWDAHHRVNAEQIYCYCGLNGEWYAQMLQCARCKQWFHEKCIRCLTHPLYSGDRFYVFVCSMCNYGKEFVRRLEMKWVDLVHLMLYNLTVYNAKKYYDLDTVIIPYANDNWHTLQLPPRIRDVSAQVRRVTILAMLTNNRNRFKCGREIKKRTTIWGLRVRLPPPCPVVNLPASGEIDDSVLRRCWGANKRLQYLPPQTGKLDHFSPVSFPENTKQLIALRQRVAENVEIPVNPSDLVMRGTLYQNSEAEQSSCPSPSPPSQSTQSLRERYSGGGFVKKSFPFPKLSLQRRRRLMVLGSSRERMLRKHKKREKSGDNAMGKSQGVREARYRKARKLLKNAIAKSKSRSSEASDLPPTPPTSVSGPPTPPAATSGMSELSVPSSVDLMHPMPLSTPADTSGDETSSRAKRQLSEKDIIVDRNGQVKRRRQHRGRGRPPQQQIQQQFQHTASKTAAILPARNNEVKSEFVRNLRSSFNGASSSASSQIGNCVDYALNGRRLRQRQNNDKVSPPDPQSQRKSSMPSSPKCSPVKQSAPDISLDDLKSSVNIYFGAANRIAAGEKFVIKAKRIGPNGQTQYLIEWEGLNT